MDEDIDKINLDNSENADNINPDIQDDQIKLLNSKMDVLITQQNQISKALEVNAIESKSYYNNNLNVCLMAVGITYTLTGASFYYTNFTLIGGFIGLCGFMVFAVGVVRKRREDNNLDSKLKNFK